MSILNELAAGIEAGKLQEIREWVNMALVEGLGAEEILEKGLMQGMGTVGKRFAAEDMFIPEVMLSARTMHAALEVLRPLLEKEHKNVGMKGKILLGTVEGDIHDIGKSLVEMIFVANGFEVVDIGENISPQGFIKAIEEHKPDVVGLSALLTTTMPAMARTVEAISAAGLRDNGQLKIIVGGAPVTEEFAREINADFYGENALDGVEAIKKALSL